ncbi:MAG: hypothetical protein AAGC68_00660 [Verrucomicrobiota bacterium]
MFTSFLSFLEGRTLSLVIVGAVAAILGSTSSFGETNLSADQFLPNPITAETFVALKGNSPFRRSVDFSDSLVLTGMARIEGKVYATLFDSESTESHVVSENVNSSGWQIVGVRGDEEDLESLTAKIQVDGGEVYSIRYAKIDFPARRGSGSSSGGAGSERGDLSQEQIEAARRAARDPAEGFRGDGYRGSPPPEILNKLRQISPQQREVLARRVMQMRNNGVDSEVRQRVYREGLDRAVQGRR